ncbi:MAG TPA: TonB-dependent receptor plug domain-containing protein, partial [Steroidobacteraceae bacterium]|nr:TonB-dependent receptor plug domain-containing protein [Steroidobacteraceae bacterium]
MNFWKPATMLGAASFALGVGLSSGAFAQNAGANSDQLEEVVVTAEKRAVNLQKVPESIQVKQGEDLRREGKKRIDDIMQGTVGIQAQDSQVGVTFFVRGVDSSAGMGGVVAVPILVDGVAQSRSESVRGSTLDLGQAEIMRGPQSTTLGANALAGAVSLVSNQPVLNQVAGNGSLEFGDFDKRTMEGVFNAPLSDTTALRVAYSSDKRKGYISAGAGDSDLRNVRAKLRWQPNQDLNSVFTVSQQDIGGNGVQSGVLLSQGYWHPVTPANAAAAGIVGSACGSTLPNVTLMGCPATFYTDGTGP